MIDRYRELFQSSADGVIVLDEHGSVLWLNRAAEQATGYATAGLVGRPLIELVAEPQRFLCAYAFGPGPRRALGLGLRLGADHHLARVSAGVDVDLGGAVAASADRAVVPRCHREAHPENELRKTKEFLERLIDSTVDGIIAADIRGQVVLFNRGRRASPATHPKKSSASCRCPCCTPKAMLSA